VATLLLTFMDAMCVTKEVLCAQIQYKKAVPRLTYVYRQTQWTGLQIWKKKNFSMLFKLFFYTVDAILKRNELGFDR
jgi:hypothetical protein